MNTSKLKTMYTERKKEVDEYIELLLKFNGGVPYLIVNDEEKNKISPGQVKILKSTVFLLLYNLTEMVMNSFIGEINSIIRENYRPNELSLKFYDKWLVYMLKARDSDVDPEGKLQRREDLVKNLREFVELNRLLIDFEIERKNGGNWSLPEMRTFFNEFGINIEVKGAARGEAEKIIYNDKNVFAAVKDYRNKLAHGEESFEQCSESLEISWFKGIRDRMIPFLDALVEEMDNYLNYLQNK